MRELISTTKCGICTLAALVACGLLSAPVVAGDNCGSAGSCFQVHKTPGCEDVECCQLVCAQNSFCCDDAGIWEQGCVDLALQLCDAPKGGQCAGFCGGTPDGLCFCDDACFGFSDCCPGVCDDCPDLAACGGSCVGACGGQTAAGCWCDAACCGFLDCCPDEPEVCNNCGTGKCDTTCPVGGIQEGEACGDDENGGCNSEPPVFGSLSAGDTVCGTLYTFTTPDGDSRDTDFYELDLSGLTETALVTWSVNCSAATDVFIINDQCGDDLVIIATGSGSCPDVATACLEPGVYRLFVALTVFDGFDCPDDIDYTGTVTVEPDAASCVQAPCEGDVEITQNTNDVLETGGVACAGGGITTENSFARSYNLANFPAVAGEDFTVTCVQFGVNNTGPAIDVDINLYIDTNGGTPTNAATDLNLIGSTTVNVPPGTNLALFNAGFPGVVVPADSVLVVEMDVAAQTAGRLDYAGNDNGETQTAFILSASCGITTYTAINTLNGGEFANLQWVQSVLGNVGAVQCLANAACPGDVTGNGTVDGADLGALLLDFGTDGCPQTGDGTVFATDLTGNGLVDGGDLGDLLLGFGACP